MPQSRSFHPEIHPSPIPKCTPAPPTHSHLEESADIEGEGTQAPENDGLQGPFAGADRGRLEGKTDGDPPFRSCTAEGGVGVVRVGVGEMEGDLGVVKWEWGRWKRMRWIGMG